MAKKIKIDIEVNGKMQKATVSTKKLRTALDGVDKSQGKVSQSARTADRNIKGVAQASANGTKNFSKMAQGIGGTLVPAYAALAANIFAVTAAFGAFQRAAQLEQLETSLIRIGNVGGRNLSALADSLKDITDSAIDSESALRAVAQGTTQGFSGTQLKGLTTIAKGASIALGRDMNDALDRLIRGVAKLEPEILDELGIIVRLDDASRDYAATLGKTTAQLTAFEKQQAFANSVLDQGTKKFAGIASAAKANPFDQLAASFGDLKKAFFEGVGVVLNPFIKLLSTSDTALVGAIALLAGTIVSQLTPALGEMATKSRQSFVLLEKRARVAALKIQSDFDKMASSLSSFDSAPKGFKDLQNQMKSGTKDAKVYSTALKKIGGSIGGQTTALNKLMKAQKGQSGAQLKATKLAIQIKQQEIQQLKQMQAETIALRKLQEGGIVGGGSARQERAAGNAKVSAGIGRTEAAASKMMADAGLMQQFKIAGAATDKMASKAVKAEGAFGKLAAAGQVAAGSARLFGSALLNAIPVIGQVIFFGGMLMTFLDSFINFPWEKTKIEQATDKIISNIDKITESSLELRLQLMQTSDAVERSFLKMKNASGITDQLADSFASLAAAQTDIDSDEISKYVEQIRSLSGGYFEREFTAINLSGEAIERLRERGKIITSNTVATEKKLMLEEKINKIMGSNTIEAGEALKVAVAARRQAAESLGTDSKAYIEVNRAVQEIGKRIKNNEDITQEYLLGVSAAVNKTADGIRRLDGAFEGMGQAITTFTNDITALVKKQDTPFTPLIASGAVLEGTLKSIKDELSTLDEGISVFDAIKNRAGEPGEAFALGLRGSKAYTSSLIEQTPNQGIFDPANPISTPPPITRDMQAVALEAAMADFNVQVAKADAAFSSTKDKVQIIKSEIKAIGRFSKENASLAEEQGELEQSIITIQKQNIETVQGILSEHENVSGVKEYLASLAVEANRLDEESKRINEDNLVVLQAEAAERKKLFDFENRILGVKRKAFELEQQEKNLADGRELRQLKRNPFFEILDQGRAAIDQDIKRTQEKLKFEKTNQDTINAAKTAMIQAEYALIDAQLRAEMEKLRLRAGNSELTNAQRGAAGASATRLEGLIGKESGGGTLGEAQVGAVTNAIKESDISVDVLQDKLDSLKESKRDLLDINVLTDGIATSLESNLTSAFTSILDGTKSAKAAFADMAKSILQYIIQMTVKMLIFRAISGFFSSRADAAFLGTETTNFETGAFVRTGGIISEGRKMPGYSAGGIARGSQAGYPAMLHGTEAVVPLPNGRSIPVQMSGAGQENNVTVNVAVDNQGSSTTSIQQRDGTGAEKLGIAISEAVKKELLNQKRVGGMLSPYGVA